jgi:hypothetical protein
VRKSLRPSIALASVLLLAFTATAFAAPSHRTIQILDNCDGPSFNAVIGEGACQRESGLDFETFFAKLSSGGAQSYRFSPEQAKVETGGTVTAINRGGEFHTFTEVAAFGGGCVPPINEAMGLEAVPECDDPSLFGTTGVAPGASVTTPPIDAGANLFQCLIHPWQRATVTGI